MVIGRLQKSYRVAGIFFFAIVVALPFVFLACEALKETNDVWMHIVDYLLLDTVMRTTFLAFTVFTGAVVLGTLLAWIVTMYEFPGKSFFAWGLLFPFALPTYVVAFTFFDLAQNVQFSLFLKNPVGISIVMIISFYPYTYLVARQALIKQGRQIFIVCRSLGYSSVSAFFKGLLPAIRPAILLSGVLICLEVLADFGAVSIFNYDTFTTVIYKSWYSLFSLSAAARLSFVLVFFSLIILFFEKFLRRRIGYDSPLNQKSEHSQGLQVKLKAFQSLLLTFFCSSVLGVAFIFPVSKLVYDSMITLFDDSQWLGSFLQESFNSLIYSVVGAIFILIMILLISFSYRRLLFPRRSKWLVASLHVFLKVGYALPGTVIAAGIFLVFSYLEQNLSIALHGFLMVIIAYAIRFWSVGYNPIEKNWLQMSTHYDKMVLSLGNPKWKALSGVYFWFFRSAIGVSAMLLFLDILKELPITLMLRPFGWDSLPVKIYELTSEGLYTQAAIPALLIIAVSFFPILFVFHLSNQRSL